MSQAHGDSRHLEDLFRAEIQIMLGFSHQNIVTLFDVDADDGTPFVVLEWIEGRSVDHILKAAPNKRLHPALALRICSEVCRGLEYAHAYVDRISGRPSPVIHRDVSPSNILVATDGNVKLIDFGVAKLVTGTVTEGERKIVGKMHYLAPEQCSGERLDASADVFSLGVVLWEMLLLARTRSYVDPSSGYWDNTPNEVLIFQLTPAAGGTGASTLALTGKVLVPNSENIVGRTDVAADLAQGTNSFALSVNGMDSHSFITYAYKLSSGGATLLQTLQTGCSALFQGGVEYANRIAFSGDSLYQVQAGGITVYDASQAAMPEVMTLSGYRQPSTLDQSVPPSGDPCATSLAINGNQLEILSISDFGGGQVYEGDMDGYPTYPQLSLYSINGSTVETQLRRCASHWMRTTIDRLG